VGVCGADVAGADGFCVPGAGVVGAGGRGAGLVCATAGRAASTVPSIMTDVTNVVTFIVAAP